jgi:hypothetical protein
MNEEQKNLLCIKAMDWFNRTHIGRSAEERQAYLEGVEDALTAVYEGTYHGAYPAHDMNSTLEELFEEGEERRK